MKKKSIALWNFRTIKPSLIWRKMAQKFWKVFFWFLSPIRIDIKKRKTPTYIRRKTKKLKRKNYILTPPPTNTCGRGAKFLSKVFSSWLIFGQERLKSISKADSALFTTIFRHVKFFPPELKIIFPTHYQLKSIKNLKEVLWNFFRFFGLWIWPWNGLWKLQGNEDL